jgi:hypothetical protein
MTLQHSVFIRNRQPYQVRIYSSSQRRIYSSFLRRKIFGSLITKESAGYHSISCVIVDIMRGCAGFLIATKIRVLLEMIAI